MWAARQTAAEQQLSKLSRDPQGGLTAEWTGPADRPSTHKHGAGNRPDPLFRWRGPHWSWASGHSAGEWSTALSWRAAGPVDRVLATPPDPLPSLVSGSPAQLLVAVREQPAWHVWQSLGAVLGVKLATPTDRPGGPTDLVAAWFAALPLEERVRVVGYGLLGGAVEELWLSLDPGNLGRLTKAGWLPAAQLSAATQAACRAVRLSDQARSAERILTELQALQTADWSSGLACWADGWAMLTAPGTAGWQIWHFESGQPPTDLSPLVRTVSHGRSAGRRTPTGVRQTELDCPSRYNSLHKSTLVGETTAGP